MTHDVTVPMWGLILFAIIAMCVWFPKAWRDAKRADEAEAREEEKWVLPIHRRVKRYNESNARYPWGDL